MRQIRACPCSLLTMLRISAPVSAAMQSCAWDGAARRTANISTISLHSIPHALTSRTDRTGTTLRLRTEQLVSASQPLPCPMGLSTCTLCPNLEGRLLRTGKTQVGVVTSRASQFPSCEVVVTDVSSSRTPVCGLCTVVVGRLMSTSSAASQRRRRIFAFKACVCHSYAC